MSRRFRPPAAVEADQEGNAVSELSADALHMTSPLRTGRRVGRHLYVQIGPEPSDDDPPVGTVDSDVLGERIVRAVNAAAPVAREDTEPKAVRQLREAIEHHADGFPLAASHIQDRLDVVQAEVDRLRPQAAPDPQSAAPTRDEVERMADVALGVLRGGGADSSGEDEEALRSLARAVADSDEAPDMGLAWLTDYTHAETEDAWLKGTCLLGKCADRRYPDAVCEHDLDDNRHEVVRLRRVVQRIAATNITHLSRQYRAICKRYGRASAEIARLRGENARLRTEEREEITKLRAKLTAARPHYGHIARLATAAGVSPDSEDVVGAIEAAIRAGRDGHEDLFAAEADYWQKRHTALAGRVGAAVKALSAYGHLPAVDTEAPPEPPVGTTFTNSETGAIAWQRQADGWHCGRDDCRNCPAGWDEACDWSGGVDGLVRHLPVVRVGTGGGETSE